MTEVPNHGSRPTILLRESFRQEGKVRNRTLANLSHWAEAKVVALRAVLKGATSVGKLEEAFDILGSRPHGTSPSWAPCASSTSAFAFGSPTAGPCTAMIVARLLNPPIKLPWRGNSTPHHDQYLGEELALVPWAMNSTRRWTGC